MSTLMRKHRRTIMIVLVLFAGFPLVFAGVGSLGSGNQTQYADGVPQSVGQVGDVPLDTSRFLERYGQAVQRRTTDTVEPTPQDLVNDGTVEQILDMMVNDALVQLETQRRGLQFDREYLVEALKDYGDFKNDQGEFDPALWNQFVSVRGDAINWNSIYAMVAENVSRKLYGELLVASARVLEPELREEFEKANTTIKVRSAAIEPKVELTEEELRAYFDENQDRYKTPEQRVATVVSISLLPDADAAAAEVLEKARAGEDFGELAREYSLGPEKDQGGDLGWVVETTNTPPHRMPLFGMQVNEISDPIQGPSGVYVYKVIAERTSDIAGKRDVLAKQILLKPEMTEEMKNAKRDLAEGLVTIAKEKNDLATVAASEGFEATTTSPFSQQSAMIEGVDPADTLNFRRDAATLEKDTISEVIEGVNNLYVAQITSITEPTPKTFEEARDDVETAAVNAYKQKPEYRDRVDEIVLKIENEIKSIDAIQAAFPDLELDVVETKAFKQEDFLFSDGIFWTPRDVFALLKDAQIGEMVGPVIDFRQVPYFIELVERTSPDEATLAATWDEERERLANARLMASQFERQQDYLQYLRERANQEYLIREDMTAVAKLIGFDDGSVKEGDEAAAPAAAADPMDTAIVEGAPEDGDGAMGDAPETSGEAAAEETPAIEEAPAAAEEAAPTGTPAEEAPATP